MPDRILSERPDLEQYRRQAKELLRTAQAGDAAALARILDRHPRVRDLASSHRALTLSDAQLVLAREHGFPSWPSFASQIASLCAIRTAEDLDDPVSAFLEVACVPRHGWHGAGSLEHAQLLLARYPELREASIYTAAVLGDETALRDWLLHDASLAAAKGGVHGWDALTYLCFSRYLRIDRERTDAFVVCARALLEAGAPANTGWTEYIDTPPRPIIESAIYGAAGIAHNAPMTRLLLEYGADPNDEETPYHVSEGYDNTVLEVLLASGTLNERSLATVAARKSDWHDAAGLAMALGAGANPNFMTAWKHSPFQHAIRRGNSLEMIEMLLDKGADPFLANADGQNAFQMAAFHGRGEVLDAFEARGFHAHLVGMDALVAACAGAQLERARDLADGAPGLLGKLHGMGGTLLGRFAITGNDAGIRTLLALGVEPDAPWHEGDGYFSIAPESTALHVAAWRAQHAVVKTLIAAGSAVNARDAHNRTPLQLAVKACTDSYWMGHRQPDSVAALLAAGAVQDGIVLPTGYDAIDRLLAHGAGI